MPCRRTSVSHPRAATAAPAHPGGAQARAAARKPGAAAAAGLRRPALDRFRDAGPARQLVESLPTARLLLLVNYRPEYQHGWGSKTYYTQLRLDPLPPGSAEAFLQALLGDDPSLTPLTRLLIARTGRAIPSFWRRACAPWWRPGAGRGTRRLSSGTNRSTACRCRPPCRRCWRPASTGCRRRRNASSRPPPSSAPRCPCPCCKLSPHCPRTTLHRGLAHLQAAEFLYETRLFPELAYTFKHALTHEVAYGSLLQERRRTLHAGIVEASETALCATA